jgi:hypothetical protein
MSIKDDRARLFQEALEAGAAMKLVNAKNRKTGETEIILLISDGKMGIPVAKFLDCPNVAAEYEPDSNVIERVTKSTVVTLKMFEEEDPNSNN